MAARRRSRRSRWEEDNRLALNPWPMVAGALLLGTLVGLAVLLSRF